MKALMIVLLLMGQSAFAQSYPSKPIRLLLTFSSGGQADILARTVTEKMRGSLGQPVLVEARPGAGGNLAMEAVAKAPPDGYTLVFGTPAVAINGRLYKQLAYDPLKDLAPLSLAAWGPYIVYASGALPVSSMSELIAMAKAKPGELNYASVGVGSGTHLATVLFTLAAGVQMTHVPYKGIQQVAPDLVSGGVHLTFNAFGPLAQFVNSGRVKMLATTAPRRIPQLPDLPTIAESGVPGFEAGGFLGLVAPAGTPPAVINALNAAGQKSLALPDVRERLLGLASPPVGGSPEQFASHIKREIDKWARVIRTANIKPE